MIKLFICVQGGIGLALTLGTTNEGIIPINKNMWYVIQGDSYKMIIAFYVDAPSHKIQLFVINLYESSCVYFCTG